MTIESKSTADYRTVTADEALRADLSQLVRLAIAEDLDRALDWTTVCLIDPETPGQCDVVPRQPGIAAGVVLVPWILDEFDAELNVELLIDDGQPLVPGTPIIRLSGNARDLLTAERTILNILSRLCGVATLTGQFVKRIAGAKSRLYDTRKTTPGWRRLEKYAVHCGGGNNHRTGLFDGFLIKDNHLALGGTGADKLPASEAAKRAIQWRGGTVDNMQAPGIVEIEVDGLDQLEDVLPASPDIVLVDNFTIEQLRQAVRMRDRMNPAVQLEASGNVKIDTIAEIASTGVDRISSGALTHQATWLDLGLDWSGDSAS
ncbi:MAG: carboxylating nicotinate-nucleotide diphosphorylase [Planctomycetota bacterium]